MEMDDVAFQKVPLLRINCVAEMCWSKNMDGCINGAFRIGTLLVMPDVVEKPKVESSNRKIGWI